MPPGLSEEVRVRLTLASGAVFLLPQECNAFVESMGAWVQTSAPSLTGCVTLVKGLNPSVPQFQVYKRWMIMVHVI